MSKPRKPVARWYHYLFFLMGLAVLSRVVSDPQSPGLLSGISAMIGNLFKSTIHG